MSSTRAGWYPLRPNTSMPASRSLRTVRCPCARSSRPSAGAPGRVLRRAPEAAADGFGTWNTVVRLTLASGIVASRSVPAPGQAELPAANAAALLRRNGTDALVADRPALRFDDRVWTHRDYL